MVYYAVVLGIAELPGVFTELDPVAGESIPFDTFSEAMEYVENAEQIPRRVFVSGVVIPSLSPQIAPMAGAGLFITDIKENYFRMKNYCIEHSGHDPISPKRAHIIAVIKALEYIKRTGYKCYIYCASQRVVKYFNNIDNPLWCKMQMLRSGHKKLVATSKLLCDEINEMYSANGQGKLTFHYLSANLGNHCIETAHREAVVAAGKSKRIHYQDS